MKNLKFGVFCLGLATAVGGAVSGLGAQDRVVVAQGSARGPSTSLRPSSLMMLDAAEASLASS